jgi:hypothetical protein
MKTKLCAILAALIGLWPGPVWAFEGKSIREDVEDTAGQIADLKQRVQAVRVEGFEFDVDARYLDARVSMDMKRWDEASNLLFSLVENPAFRADPRWPECQLLLGTALYNQRNFDGAKGYFEALLNSPQYLGDAMIHLVDIAEEMNRTEDLAAYAAKARALAATGGDKLRYAQGRAEFLIGNLQGSRTVLEGVGPDSEFYFRARYIQAVILTAQGRNDEAIAAFKDISERGHSVKDEAIIELADLSVARLSYEVGDLSQAVDYYQRIPRQSLAFRKALYETTHLHLKAASFGDTPEKQRASYAKALEALEILSASSDLGSQMSIETTVLRGRINFLMGVSNYARESYQAVVDRFAPLAAELWEFTRDPARVEQWFDSLVESAENPLLKRQMLSDEAADWVRDDKQLGRAVNLLSDISQQKADMFESEDSLFKLKAALNQQEPRNLFLALSNAWVSSIEYENSLMVLYQANLDQHRKAYDLAEASPEAQELRKLDQLRQGLERKLEASPRTVAQFRHRNKVVLDNLRAIERDLDDQSLRLQQFKSQIDAMHRVLREVKYKGSHNLKINDEEGIRAELELTTKDLAALYDDLIRSKMEVQKEMIVGGAVGQDQGGEANARADMWGTLQQQSALLLKALQAKGQQNEPKAVEYVRTQQHIITLLIELSEVRKTIDERAEAKAKYYRQVVVEEEKNLVENRRASVGIQERALALAKSLATPMFLAANERLGRVVLEADLGLVDIAWQRKQDRTEERETLAEEQGGTLMVLRQELKSVQEEVE